MPKWTNRLKEQNGLNEGDKELRAGVGAGADLIYDGSGAVHHWGKTGCFEGAGEPGQQNGERRS